MPFTKIFELIRKRDVVFFCGAGMSIYAGFPSGNYLAEMIYNSLSEREKVVIPANLTLPDLAEEYINLKLGNRNALHSILKEVFSISPKTNYIHKIITEIPHIQTIITTNYDNLFESSYGNECSVVRTAADIPYITNDKPTIIKIHGDLSLPNSILICKTDYTKYFDSQNEELVWTVVRERFATKTILFLGYNLDDINIESIFRKISEQLGSNFKEVYLLAPNLNEIKINTLTRKGIRYLNSTAEEFIQQLHQNIKDNINEDFQKQYIDADTYRVFLQKNHLNPSLKPIQGRFELDKIDGFNKPLEIKLSFGINITNSEFLEKITSIIEDRDISELTLDNSNVKDLSLQLNGIKFPNPDGEKIVLKPAPAFVTKIDLHFKNGAEYDDVKLEIYKTKHNLFFVIPLKCGEFKIAFTDPLRKTNQRKFNLTFTHVTGYQRINEEIETHKFLYDFASSGGITIFHPKIEPEVYRLQIAQPLIDKAEKHLYYFDGLKKIEKFYTFKFGKIDSISQSSYNTLCLILSIVEGEPFIGIWEESIKFTPTIPEKVPILLAQFSEDSNLCRTSDVEEIIEFHGKTINLGYRTVKYLRPFIVNLENVEQNPMEEIIVKSRTDSIEITFTKQLF